MEKIERVVFSHIVVPSNMPSFDLTYANEQIDSITQTSVKMFDFYKSLQDQPSAEDIHILTELYSSVQSAITDYYTYLKKTGVRPEESYLTKWLDEEYVRTYLDDIEHLIEE